MPTAHGSNRPSIQICQLFEYAKYSNMQMFKYASSAKNNGIKVDVDLSISPLLKECQHFVQCCLDRSTPITDGEEGLRVLKVLTYLQDSLKNNKEINLHQYNLDKTFSVIKLNKQKKIKFKTELEKINEKEIHFISEHLYEKGYSALDIIEYIKDLDIDALKKYEYLVYIQKIKKEFREERLLMSSILHFLLKRSDYTLENISFM